MNPQTTHILLTVIGVLGSMAAFTTAYRLFSSKETEDPTALTGLTPRQPGDVSGFEELNPRGGLIDRLDYFLAHRLGLGRRLEEIYMLLGRPEDPTPLRILHYKELAAAVFPCLLYFLIEHPAALLSAPLFFWLPDRMYQGKIRERQRQLVRNFPAFVDLAALTIESGQDYMSAFDRIVKASGKGNDLEGEVEKTLGEVQLGYSRREALRRFATRTGLQEVRSFVGLIIQSDELGTSLVDLLRNYSQDLRFRRMNKAEKAAAQASTKMLFPIFFFIFPTVFVLTLAPMLMSLFQGGLGF